VRRYREEAGGDRPATERASLRYEVGRITEEQLHDASGADAAFAEALAASPTFRVALRARRRLALARGDVDGALRFIDSEIALEGAAAPAELHRERAGLLAGDGKRRGEAVSAYREALNRRRPDGIAARGLAVTARVTRDWDALREALDIEFELATTPELQDAILHERARLDESVRGDAAAAEAGWREVLARHPDHREARLALLRILRRTERWVELAEALEREAAAAEGSARSDWLVQLACVCERHLGDRARARHALRDARVGQPRSPLVLMELLRLCEADGLWDDAAATLGDLIDTVGDPHRKASLLHRLGVTLNERIGLDEEAVEAFQGSLRADPNQPSTLQALGELLVRLGRHEDLLAMHLGEAELGTDPRRQAGAYYRAAELCAHHLDRSEEAIRWCERAIELAPGDEPAVRLLEVVYRRAGRVRELADLYERLAARSESPEMRLYCLERQAATLEHGVLTSDAAVAALEGILHASPDHATANAQLSRIYEERRSWKKLVDLLRAQAERERNEDQAAARLVRAGRICEQELADPATALELFRSALRIRPRAVDAMRAIGRMLRREGRWAELVELHRENLELSESPAQRAAVLYRIGLLLEEHLGDPDRAGDAYADAYANDPGYLPAVEGLIRLHVARGDEAGAIDFLDAQASGCRDPRHRAVMLFRLALLQESPLGRIDAALDYCTQALDLDPSLTAALEARERLLRHRGDWRAVADLLAARAESAGSDETFRLRAELGFVWSDNVGNAGRAAEEFARALALRPTSVLALRMRVESLRPTESWRLQADALDTLVELIRSDPVRTGHLWDRLVCAERGGEPPEVAALVTEEIARLNPDDSEAGLRREHFALLGGDAAGLAAELEAAARREREHPAHRAALLTRLADWQARLGRMDDAVCTAAQAIEIDPGSLPAVSLWITLAEATGSPVGVDQLRRLAATSRDPAARGSYLLNAARIVAEREDEGGWREARSLLLEALTLVPSSVEAMGGLIRLHGSREAWDTLVEDLRGLTERLGPAPEAADALYMLATVQRDRLGRTQDAISTLNRILHIAPEHAPALSDLADLYADEDLFNEAVAIYRQLLRTDADESFVAQAAVHLSVLLEDKLQDNAQALQVLEETRQRHPGAVPVLERLVALYRREERWRDAHRLIEGLLAREDLAGRRVGYRLMLADIVLDGYDDEGEAEAILRTAAEEETIGTRALARLLRHASDRGRWQDVADLIERRLGTLGGNLQPEHAPLLLELAKVYAQHLRRPGDAVAAQERALALDPENRTARLRLAELHAESGGAERAVELARSVLEADPGERGALRVIAEKAPAGSRLRTTAALALRGLGGDGRLTEEILASHRDRTLDDLAGLTLPPPVLRSLLPPAAQHPATDILALVSPTVGVLYAAGIESHGVRRRDRLGPRDAGDMVAVVETAARAVGLEDIPAWLAPIPLDRGVRIEPEARAALAVPRELAAQPLPARIFHVGRALGKLALGLHLTEKLAPGELVVLLHALAMITGNNLRHSIPPGDSAADLSRRLEREIPRRILRALEPIAPAYAARPLADPAAYLVGVEQAADRIGLVLSDALDVAVRVAVRRDRPDADPDISMRESVARSSSARALLRFALSGERDRIGL
jgi:tetratricopeptide (TPR) repeat protein